MRHRSILLPLLTLMTSIFCACSDDQAKERKKVMKAVDLNDDKNFMKKRLAVFDQLRKKLKSGMTSTEVSKAIGKEKWLEHIRFYEITALGGKIPVDINPERAFAIILYPYSNGRSSHVVYFSLSNVENDRLNYTIEDFLRGKVKGNDTKLHQFAMCSPDKATKRIITELIPKRIADKTQ